MVTDLIKAFEALSSEKTAVRKREDQLVSDLTAILGRLGYRLEPMGTNGAFHPSRSTPVQRAVSRGSKPLTCAECDRTFALALHLGRHMTATHKGKRAAAPNRQTECRTS